MQVQAQRTGRESTNTMRMLQGPTNLLTEYMLKTFVETFVQPVLRQVMMLEQHYESDLTLIQLAGQKAQVFKRYDMDSVTDAVLDNELNITVNVGMGNTDPAMKIQRFAYALQVYTGISKMPPLGIDMKEVWKELAGLSGYQDGSRFVVDGANPEVIQLQRQIAMLTQKLAKSPAAKEQQVRETNATKERIADKSNIVKLALADKKHVSESRQMLVQHLMDVEKGATQRVGDVEDRDFEAGEARQARADEGAMREKEAKRARSGKS
jgi:hypothetical protein